MSAPGGDAAGEVGRSATEHGSRAELDALLNAILERPYDREEIEREIEEKFTGERAVMALDMSGFSRTTQIRGIVPYLLMIHQMRLLAEPVIEKHSGSVVSAEADNLLCVFDAVEDALVASREITGRLDAANLMLPKDLELYVSIGVGYGHLLVVGNDQIFGNEVNLASKLGEDVADRGEILLTPGARARISDADDSWDERAVTVSGLELTYYALQT